MPLDPYSPCICGSGKKLKFCCGSEIPTELSKVYDLVTGDQRVAALDQINQLLEKPANAKIGALHHLKTLSLLELGDAEQARTAATNFREALPDSSVAYAFSAMVELSQGLTDVGEDYLQTALELADGRITNQLYSAITSTWYTWLQTGELLAARAHAHFLVQASKGQDRNSVNGLIEIESNQRFPLVALSFENPGSADANGRLSATGMAEFNAANELWFRGCWRKASQTLAALAEREPYEPAVWKNLGLNYTAIGKQDEAAQALRRYASFASVPRDSAVEMEAIAQYLLGPAEIETIPELTLVYGVTDSSVLQEHLLSNRQLIAQPFNRAEYAEYEDVPPLSIFRVLDREVPATAAGLALENVPKVLGDIYLFGKQTDRAARLEFETIASDSLDAKLKTMLELVGPQVGEKQSQEETGRVTRLYHELVPNWQMPADADLPTQQKLALELRDKVLLNLWPTMPLGCLDGKTLAHATNDASLQTRALAAILLMELSESTSSTIYNQLRKQLGLPTLEPIDLEGRQVKDLTCAQYTRLTADKLSDDDLMFIYRRARIGSNARLIKQFAPEVLRRPALEKGGHIGDLCELLASMSADSDEALAYILRAQEYAISQQQSPARYLISEIPIRLARREVGEFQRIFDRLRTKHMNEQGVAEAMQKILLDLGLLRPDGSLNMPTEQGSPVTPASAPAGGSLWTPEQGSAAPAGKSKLWVPGMD